MNKSRKYYKHYRYILALDPSGSFYEGKGTTGWAILDTDTMLFKACGSLFAKDYYSAEEYWEANVKLVLDISQRYANNLIVVCEDYLLYANKLNDQINSRMETPKLIGVLQHCCYMNHIPYYMQTASEVKHRWTNKILLHKHYIIPKGNTYISNPETSALVTFTHHTIDAIRHAIHYATFKNK